MTPEQRARVIKDAVEDLCIYDPRNPLGADVKDRHPVSNYFTYVCNCDNCFYGRSRLADVLLRVVAENKPKYVMRPNKPNSPPVFR